MNNYIQKLKGGTILLSPCIKKRAFMQLKWIRQQDGSESIAKNTG